MIEPSVHKIVPSIHKIISKYEDESYFIKTYKWNKRKEIVFFFKIDLERIQFIHKLPKIIHIIWITHNISKDNKVPDDVQKNIMTFSMYRDSGWNIFVWNNEKVRKIFCDYDNQTHHHKDFCDLLMDQKLSHKYGINLAMKADMLRYFIIYEFGGIYFDSDFISIKKYATDN